MELVCPQCLGELVLQDGGSVRCRIHGGEYQLLFVRSSAIASPEPPSPPPPPVESASDVVSEPAPEPAAAPPGNNTMKGKYCDRHPIVDAVCLCGACQKPICLQCAKTNDEGITVCPECLLNVGEPLLAPPSGLRLLPRAPVAPPPLPPPPAAFVGRKCAQHPNSTVVQLCKLCGAGVCVTCDFALPGNVHICPACAAKPRGGLSPQRKKLMIASYALAVWATLGTACLFAGAFAGMARTKGDQFLLGMLLLAFVLGPALGGLGSGIGARNRHAPNSPFLWIAIVWNALLIALYGLLTIVGLFSKD